MDGTPARCHAGPRFEQTAQLLGGRVGSLGDQSSKPLRDIASDWGKVAATARPRNQRARLPMQPKHTADGCFADTEGRRDIAIRVAICEQPNDRIPNSQRRDGFHDLFKIMTVRSRQLRTGVMAPRR